MTVNTQLLVQMKATCAEFCLALTDDEVAKFLRYTCLRELGAGEVVADYGEVMDRFYLIIGGSVRLLHPADTDDADDIEVGHLKPGSLVGEMSFFDGRPRTLRLRTGESGARLLEINRPMYNRLRIEEPYVATNLLEFTVRSLDSLVRSLSDEKTKLHNRVQSAG